MSMTRDTLTSALLERYADRGIVIGESPAHVASFPARHAEVGDLRIWVGPESSYTVTARVGDILTNHFHNYDEHLRPDDRIRRLKDELVWFLDALFGDRLLLWRSVGNRNSGWRERRAGELLEPLVLDNYIYRLYQWSGPLGTWQAAPAILGRGQIRDDREHDILAMLLEHGRAEDLDEAQRELARRLIRDYATWRAR